MRLRPLPEGVKSKIDDWLGDYVLLHWWFSEDSYFVVTKSNHAIFFLRVFKLGQGLVLSQDNLYDEITAQELLFDVALHIKQT